MSDAVCHLFRINLDDGALISKYKFAYDTLNLDFTYSGYSNLIVAEDYLFVWFEPSNFRKSYDEYGRPDYKSYLIKIDLKDFSLSNSYVQKYKYESDIYFYNLAFSSFDKKIYTFEYVDDNQVWLDRAEILNTDGLTHEGHFEKANLRLEKDNSRLFFTYSNPSPSFEIEKVNN